MTKLIFILLFSFSAFANPKLSLLAGHNWKAPCRKVVTEGNQEIPSQASHRLQSSYSVLNEELLWTVTLFRDPKCCEIKEADRHRFRCSFKPTDVFAACNQLTREHTTDGTTWIANPLVDHAGVPNALELKIKVQPQGRGLRLTSVGESEDEEHETLAR